MKKNVKVTFQPEGRSIHVLPGTSIFEAAGQAGIIIDSPCGSEGTCGKCRVSVLRGKDVPNATEESFISKEDLEKGIRLACQAKIYSEMAVEVPSSSRFSAQRILTSDVLADRREIRSGVRKVCLELEKPSLNDPASFSELIRRKTGDFKISAPVSAGIAKALKGGNNRITCVFFGNELIAAESGDTVKENYGVAFDLGTTTVVGALVNLDTGKDLAVCARMNPQVIYGDDVISRINHTVQSEKGLEDLRALIVKAFNEIITELAGYAGISKEHIYKLTVAGNSTMQHIFLDIPPESLGVIPFVPVVKEEIESKAGETGININPLGKIFVFPNIAGFVGGDTVAVMLAARLYEGKKLRLTIDIGTNGEIVLGNEDRLVCASAAAGPAFEGARIFCGMRGTGGAIEKIVFRDDVEMNVIDNLKPAGICGSGLIDAAAEMLRAGIIDETGRMLARGDIPAGVPEGIAERIAADGKGNSFTLSADNGAGKPVVIVQKDIRELQLAKGAIYAGIKILEKELGVSDSDIDEVLLAGAFGNYIRKDNAKEIGLLPDIPVEKVRFIGNAALSGSKVALLSEDQRVKAGEISKSCEYIELSTSADFQNEFADAMLFRK